MTRPQTTAFARLHLVGIAVVTALAGVLVGLVLTPPTPVPGVPAPDAVVRYGLPVVRVLFDLAAVATVGLNLLPVLVGTARPKAAEQMLAGTRRAAAFSALALAVCALVALVLQTAEVRVGPDSSGVSPAAVVDYVVTVSAGKALVFVAAVALVSFALSIWAVRSAGAVPAEPRAAVALFALLPLPVTGHATDWRWQDYAMISMELHVLGAAAWTGGLAALVVLVAHRRGLLAEALPKFSKLATIALVLVSVTGLFNGLLELALNPVVGLPGSLFTTSYGLVLVGKVVCAALLAVLGANIRWRFLPHIAQHRTTAIVGWAAVELAIMGIAFGLAVVLSRAPVA